MFAAVATPASGEGLVRGRVALELPGMQLADLGPVVVYVDAREGAAAATTGAPPTVRQKNASFVPGFLALAAGQRVVMPNEDVIYHNVFSYSRPNDFDLGLYPSGQSRTVPFAHPGVVKIYCSIHESMNGTLFVSPTPWFAVASADGTFTLRGVPAGPQHLKTWNEKLPDTEHEVVVPPSGEITVELSLLPQSMPATLQGPRTSLHRD